MRRSDLKKLFVNVSKVKVDKILFTQEDIIYYPFFISGSSEGVFVEVPSPLHGRSIIADYDKKTNRFIITKGNGLTYFPFGFITTQELEGFAWGYLRQEDAIRDYSTGLYVESLGLSTNKMEAVFTLEPLTIRSFGMSKTVNPTILQYNVLCPYRLADIPFLSRNTVKKYLKLWFNFSEEKEFHCIAAEIFLKNLKVMREHDVLHNAIHSQNYTLALELVDFELSRSPITPYGSPEDEKNYPHLMDREIIQSLEIVNYVAFQLDESLNVKKLNKLMLKYGFGDLI